MAEDHAQALAGMHARATALVREVREFRERQAAVDARQVLKLEALGGRASREEVEELAAAVMVVLADAQERIAPLVCRKATTNPAGLHYKPRKVASLPLRWGSCCCQGT